MTTREIGTSVGLIVTNLQSLEFALRLLISETVGPRDTSLKLEHLHPGDIVAEGPFTDWSSLGEVIRRANSVLEDRDVADRVDESLVELRDAIAHGHVFALEPNGPYTLVKFARPRDGKVEVESVVELTDDRLRLEVKRSGDEILKVVGVARALGLGCFPGE